MTSCTLVMSKPRSKLGSDLQKLTYAFLDKLTADDSAPGLHIEPINNSRDPRVRTGRVNQQFRAVLFRLDGTGGPQGSNHPIYVFAGVWNHDEAIAWARKSELTVNPVNGITEIRLIEDVEDPGQLAGASQVVGDGGSAVPTRRDPDLPTVLGYTTRELRDELGLDPGLAEKAARASSEDALLELAAQAQEWQGIALLDLASGSSIEDVKAKLAIEAAPDGDGTVSEDARIVEGFSHPAAQLTFTYIEDNEELRRVIEGGDVGAWRVFLHPEQRAYAERDFNGPYRLSGGAGTGKTVVLLHRARRLALAEPSSRILLTTFTTNLAAELANGLTRLDPQLPQGTDAGEGGIAVSGIDAMASSVLAEAGSDLVLEIATLLGDAPSSAGVARRTDAVQAWRLAIDSAGGDLPAELRSPTFFEAEYTMVVLPNRIADRDAYLRIRRPGRGCGSAERSAWRSGV